MPINLKQTSISKQYLIVSIISILAVLYSFKKATSHFKPFNNVIEKVYIHFDKPFYTAGEDIWFKVYLLDGVTLKSNTISKMVHVDLVNPNNEIVESRTIKIDLEGGAGEFHLSKDLPPGVYRIRAYTNYMQNFDKAYYFRKNIPIYAQNGNNIKVTKEDNKKNQQVPVIVKPDVQFFPEGGHMVTNFLNRIGFKAIGSNGKGIEIIGIIYDQDGNKVSKFKSSKFGMGMFRFVPQSGKVYTAEVDYNGNIYTYALEDVLEKGILLMVLQEQENYKITLLSSMPNGTKNLSLVGIQKDLKVCDVTISASKSKATIMVPVIDFNDGIIQFTVFNDKKEPICERLVFYQKNSKKQKVDILPIKNNFGKRKLVEVMFKSSDNILTPKYINSSVSVIDASIINQEDKMSINSYLLLNSELKGNIENPDYYFESNDPNRKKNLDFLMMSQGWRSYEWSDNYQDNNKKRTFPYEEGVPFKGTVRSFYNHEVTASAELSLTYRNKEIYGQDKTKTFDHGHFSFGQYEFKDSTSIIIQAQTHSSKGKGKINKDYFIQLDSFIPPKVLFRPNDVNYLLDTINAKYVNRNKSILYYDLLYGFGIESEKLDEIELKAHINKDKKYTKYKGPGMLHLEPTQRVDFQELPNLPYSNIFRMLEGRVPGIKVSSDGIILRGTSSITLSSQPLYFLDGVRSDFSILSNIPVSDVYFVDIVKGVKAAIYGPGSSNGVILVYTIYGSHVPRKNGIDDRKGIINFIYPGFYKARKFYEPIYKVNSTNKEKPDLRTTISWKPMLKFDDKGNAKISFYTADKSATYKIKFEGITWDGKPLVSSAFINVD